MMIKIWNILVNLILTAALLLVFAFAGTGLIGLTPYVVTSGSMQSVYPAGSVIYVRDAVPEDVQVGDAITFYLGDDTVAVHQVWQINPEEKTFRTQGVDNLDLQGNIIQDAAPVSFENLIGLPVACIPKLGMLYDMLQKPAGMCAVAFVVILTVLVLVLLTPSKETAAGQGISSAYIRNESSDSRKQQPEPDN